MSLENFGFWFFHLESTFREAAREAAWPSGQSVGFEIRRSRVQIPFWPLADVVLGSPEYNFSATLVNSQLVCLPPVGILNLVMFIWILIHHCLHWSWKAQMGSGQLSIHIHTHTYTQMFLQVSQSGCTIKGFVQRSTRTWPLLLGEVTEKLRCHISVRKQSDWSSRQNSF